MASGSDGAGRRRLFSELAGLADAATNETAARLDRLYAPDAQWLGSHPLNAAQGPEVIATRVWVPLKVSLPDLERRDLIFVGGDYRDAQFIAAMGHYCGTFVREWLGIPATGRPVYLRYGEVHRIAAGRIAARWCLWDVLDLIRQAGHWPIAPSLGVEGMWPGPLTGNGLRLDGGDPVTGAASLAQTLEMQHTLGTHDDEKRLGRKGLLEMDQRLHWHAKMNWYGPAGIGTTRGLAGFVDDHQLPFRNAFPNRKGGAQISDPSLGGHYIRIGDGPYSVTGGWPSVRARHLGGSLFGVGATGKEVTLRVMDFYLHHEGLIRENWVPIDVLDMLMQMGVDVLDRLKRQVRPESAWQ